MEQAEERKATPKKVLIPVFQDGHDDRVVQLEAVLYDPQEEEHPTSSSPAFDGGAAAAQQKTAVVVTHPHPKLGGDLRNNVVSAIFNRFVQEGICAVKFNFRGVGSSTGSWTWRGTGEREDLRAVCDYLQAHHRVSDITLIGYSYGSVISSSLLPDIPAAKACVAVSYPFGVLPFLLLGWLLPKSLSPVKPILWVMGKEDQFTGEQRFERRRKEREKAKEELMTMNHLGLPMRRDEWRLVEGADHFWRGKEQGLVEMIWDWSQRQQQQPPSQEQPHEQEPTPPSST
ncbi:DLH domain-containing protein [Balamuthia mandrillaris]